MNHALFIILLTSLKSLLGLTYQDVQIVPVLMSQSRACHHGHKFTFHHQPSSLAFLMSSHNV